MKISILIQSGPASAHDHALSMALALVRSRHQLGGVFFQHQAVHWGRAGTSQDRAGRLSEPGPTSPNGWSELACAHQVPMILCSASARAQGMQPGDLQAGFEIAGLGRWIEMLDDCDRCVQWPGV